LSLEFLNQSERQRLLAWFDDFFGIDPQNFEAYELMRRGEFIHIVTKKVIEATETLSAYETGIPLARVSKAGFFKPVTRGMQVFGHLATKGVVEIDGDDLKSLIEGRKVERPGKKGFVILKIKNTIIGVGLLKEGNLLGQLPRGMTEYLLIPSTPTLL
jgi:NOL1/NOP2/fmu family ribosome biogenesis protein